MRYNDLTLEELYQSLLNNKTEEEVLPKKRALISLCLTGKGAALEIKKYITTAIPELSAAEIEIVPLAMMQNDLDYTLKMLKKQKEIMGIIGTVDPQNKEIPFIPVRNIFDQHGINAVKALIKKSSVLTEDKEELNAMENLVTPELIFLEYRVKSKEQLIKEISSKLEKTGYVQKGFFAGLLEREKMGGTYHNGVAFPHAWPQYVKTSVIVVCTLEKPIKWEEEHEVEAVIFLALKVINNSVVKRIYSVVSNQHTNTKLKKATTKEEIMELLLENGSSLSTDG